MGGRIEAIFFLLAASVWFSVTVLSMSSPVVETALGKVRGSVLKTWTFQDILAFRGIRYAKAPVDRLRFKPPAPLEPWSGIIDTNDDGPVCPQPHGNFFGPVSEDCLYVNVYTRELASSKPVIVYFHSGGFFSASSRSDWLGPDYLLDQDIVLVTVNYRLGPLGFMSTGDKEALGNYGMKDQVAALRWVRDNIGRFGGNPGSVTIAGYSAGSTSVMLHMLSPMSKGLFHRGIAMSAGVTSNFVVNEDPLSLARRLADSVGCPTTGTTRQLVDCLRKVPADQLSGESYEKMKEWAWDPMLHFAMVIEADLGDGSERFLVDHPKNLIAANNFAHVPLVLGICKNEFDFRGKRILQNETWVNDINTDFDRIAPIAFIYERGTEKSKAFSRKLRHFYLGDKPITKDNADFGKIYSDALIIVGQEESAKLFTMHNRAPVYFYMTTYTGRVSTEVDDKTSKPLGVAHHDELLYLFYVTRISGSKINSTDPEAKTVKRFTSFWANFANKGDPTPSGESIKWTPMVIDDIHYLEIGDELSIKKGLPYPERMAVWEAIYPTTRSG